MIGAQSRSGVKSRTLAQPSLHGPGAVSGQRLPNLERSDPVAGAIASRTCPSCARAWGGGIACQFCDQVEGLPTGVHLSSPAKRFGGYLLEGVLAILTLGIGYVVWSLIVYARGQTPAKQVLKMRVVALRRGTRASWGRMFLREWIAKPVAAILCALTFGIAYFWLIWDSRNQEVWDKFAGTIVVNDPDRQLLVAPTPGPPPVNDAQDVRNWT